MSSADAHLSDSTLVARVYLDGDLEAFETLVERYRPRVFNYLYRLVQDFERSRDLTQEVFIEIAAGIPRLTSFENISGWIYRLARGVVGLDARRRRRSAPALALGDSPRGRGTETAARAAVSGNDLAGPDRQAVQRLLEIKMERAILRLGPGLRRVVSLCLVQGLPYDRAASILKIGRRTVGTRLHRARRLMAEYLDAAPDD